MFSRNTPTQHKKRTHSPQTTQMTESIDGVQIYINKAVLDIQKASSRKHIKLRDACKKTLEMLKLTSLSQVPTANPDDPPADVVLQIIETMRHACETKSSKMIIPALDSLQVSHHFHQPLTLSKFLSLPTTHFVKINLHSSILVLSPTTHIVKLIENDGIWVNSWKDWRANIEWCWIQQQQWEWEWEHTATRNCSHDRCGG